MQDTAMIKTPLRGSRSEPGGRGRGSHRRQGQSPAIRASGSQSQARTPRPRRRRAPAPSRNRSLPRWAHAAEHRRCFLARLWLIPTRESHQANSTQETSP